ncbi:hypothetical protein P7C73_g6235, partial [Tremellales sp. Uapishka_1]
MGGSASKATRKLPTASSTIKQQPSWAGVRTPNPPPSSSRAPPLEASTAPPLLQRQPQAPFSGEKDEALRQDSIDPQFMANLSKLGQVKVQDSGKFVETHSSNQRTLSSRSDIFTNPSPTPPAGYLNSVLLTNLLDELKTLPPSASPAALYKSYGVDEASLTTLRKYINSPSIGKDEVTIVNGERIVEMKALWVAHASQAQVPNA